ncbi:MAG: glycosyltransferase family 2 protein, partial [Holophagales bacterium]|nr:glycosyltransferase family 2 protein [Holophagales bacterium]
MSWNGRHHLEVCLAALRQLDSPGVPYEICVLDNGSVDGTREWVREHHPEVRLLRSEVNLGFCGGNRRLVEACDGDAVVLLNNDTRPRPGWLAALVDALAAAGDDVAAISGMIVDWSGERLDFGRGLLTFDGHAFQWHYGRSLETAEIPADGAELPFACGGNMIVWKRAFQEVGGFDLDYFAYLEDVDLGWRLWSAGYRTLFAAEAVVHHRSMATSQLLGDANRGFLFERNAFATAYKNLDPEHFTGLLPAIWTTLAHRAQTLMVQCNPGGDLLTVDPYAGLIANTASPFAPGDRADAGEAAGAEPGGPELDAPELDAPELGVSPKLGPEAIPRGFEAPPIPRTTLIEKWRGYGPRQLLRRGLRKGIRALLPSFVLEELVPSTHLQDPRTLAHLRAVTWILGHLDSLAAERQR